MPADLLDHALAAKGFMPEDEGLLLHRARPRAAPHGPALEVGTYCGKSAIYLGAAAREVGGPDVVFTVDHHRGSEENQAGWEHHDTEVVDPETGRMDTLPVFRRTVARAGLRGPGRGPDRAGAPPSARTGAPRCRCCSSTAGTPRSTRRPTTPAGRTGRCPAACCVIHDVFPDPADGGQPPYHVFLRALAQRRLRPRCEALGSMRVLRRTLRRGRRRGRLTGSRTRARAR